MKRKIGFALFLLFCLLLGVWYFIPSTQDQVTYSLDELQEHISEDGSGEVKLPGYRWYTEKFTFILKNRTELPRIKNERDKKEIEWEGVYYFAYPLPRLQMDLFIDSVKIQDFDGEWGTIDRNTPENAFWLTYYQHPTRNREQILEFLTALSSFDTETARTLLQKNFKLIPFIIDYEPISFLEIQEGEDKLFGKVWSEDAGWGNLEFFDLFISGETLYFVFSPNPNI